MGTSQLTLQKRKRLSLSMKDCSNWRRQSRTKHSKNLVMRVRRNLTEVSLFTRHLMSCILWGRLSRKTRIKRFWKMKRRRLKRKPIKANSKFQTKWVTRGSLKNSPRCFSIWSFTRKTSRRRVLTCVWHSTRWVAYWRLWGSLTVSFCLYMLISHSCKFSGTCLGEFKWKRKPKVRRMRTILQSRQSEELKPKTCRMCS